MPGETEPRSAGDPLQSKILERLLEARTVLIVGEITSRLTQLVTAQLLAMASDSGDDITVFIHSKGGHVESGDTLHDMIRFIGPRVKMVGTGSVASVATHVYVAVPREDRFCLPNTRFLIHQPEGGMGGQAADIRLEAEEILRTRQRLNQALADATGQPIERVQADTERKHWMSPQEAREYGIVGSIISSADEL